jgi:putative ATP-dependent endonuclease of the OLD family
VFDAYSNEVNSALFFAEKVVFVEGECDLRVLRTLLEKKLGVRAHRISIISAAGNRNFSPYLRMVRAWATAKIQHLVVTDFDSLTKSTERAILVGAKAAGYSITQELSFHAKVDAVLDKSEKDFSAIATEASSFFTSAGLNVFVFTSDLEHALLTDENKVEAAKILNMVNTSATDYTTGYDLTQLRRLIGSKSVPLNPSADQPFKKPYIHKKIASTIDLTACHPDILRLLDAIEKL